MPEYAEFPNQWSTVGKGRGTNPWPSNANKGGGKHLAPSPFAQNPFSPFVTHDNGSPFVKSGGGKPQQFGQYQQFTQWNQWQCHTCGTLHPSHHTHCWTCLAWYGSSGKQGKGKGFGGKGFGTKGQGKGASKVQDNAPKEKVGRWRKWNFDSNADAKPTAPAGDNDDDLMDGGEDRFDIGTPKAAETSGTMSGEKLGEVIKWLQSKGLAAEVIETLSTVSDGLKTASNSDSVARDPWRALQSAKDKIKAVDKQLVEAKDHLQVQRERFMKAEAWHDGLVDKKDQLESDIDSLQKEVGSPDLHCLRGKVDYYETLISKMQEHLQFGWPDNQSKRSELYNMIFKGETHQSTQSDDEERHKADPTEQFVDRSGFGFVGAAGSTFGPASNQKGQPSPYSKGSSLGSGKGSQVGEPAGASAAADDVSASPVAAGDR